MYTSLPSSHYIWCRISLNEIRTRNRGAPSEARVLYPLGTNHTALEVLAETIWEATNITSTY